MPSTGVFIIDWIFQALGTYGYLITLFAMVFENIFIMGSIMPGDTIVVGASLVASRGELSIQGVWVIAFVGTLLGNNISYWAGRSVGVTRLETTVASAGETWWGRLLGLDLEALSEVIEHFQTRGASTVLVARFATGVKNLIPAMAGATRMPLRWFELYTAIGAALYTTVMCVIGWFLGANFDVALRVVSAIGWTGLGLFVVFGLGLWIMRKTLRQRRLEQEADEVESLVEQDLNEDGF